MSNKINFEANSNITGLLVLYFMLIVIFFIMSSTNFLLKDEDKSVCRMTVIFLENEEEYYTNFKKGIESAAQDYKIDVNFTNISKNADINEFRSLILKEADSGTDIIMLPNMDSRRFAELDISSDIIPVFISGVVYKKSEDYMSHVSIDYQQGIDELVKSIKASQLPSAPVYIVAKGNHIHELEQLIKEKLEQDGFNVIVRRGINMEKPCADSSEAELKKTDEIPAVIMLSRGSFIETVKQCSLNKDNLNYRIYGVGTTTYLLNKLEQGYVSGIITWNEYDEGYAAALNAYMKIFGTEREKAGLRNEIIPSYYIDNNTLESGKYTKMLYPIN